MHLWLKSGRFGPFQSLPMRREKILNFQTWLKKSLVKLSWSQSAKLARKMSFKGIKMTKCAILDFWILTLAKRVLEKD